MLQLVLGAAGAAVASAHMCALEPLQRGGVEGAGSAAADVCAQTTGPCPSLANGDATQAYFAGDEIYMNLLKSERDPVFSADVSPRANAHPPARLSPIRRADNDHFNSGAPGNFSAYLWSAGYKTSTLLGSTADTNAPSLTQYRLRASLAGVAAGNYTVQTIYYTNNAQAPPAFFQCSDITVFSANAESVVKAKRAGHSHHAKKA